MNDLVRWLDVMDQEALAMLKDAVLAVSPLTIQEALDYVKPKDQPALLRELLERQLNSSPGLPPGPNVVSFLPPDPGRVDRGVPDLRVPGVRVIHDDHSPGLALGRSELDEVDQ